jgi:hypothetical protein
VAGPEASMKSIVNAFGELNDRQGGQLSSNVAFRVLP